MIDRPFHELMAIFRRFKQRFEDVSVSPICICEQLGAPDEHLCSMRYRLIEEQVKFENANIPPYPRNVA